METQLNPKDYDTCIIVAGSRKYSDRLTFDEVIRDYIKDIEGSILFISGDADSGADRLIIDWCTENNYPCLKVPADWNNTEVPGAIIKYNKFGKAYNAKAGHDRNRKMAEIAAKHHGHLLCFWDGKSPGSRNMISLGKEFHLQTKIILIEI